MHRSEMNMTAAWIAAYMDSMTNKRDRGWVESWSPVTVQSVTKVRQSVTEAHVVRQSLRNLRLQNRPGDVSNRSHPDDARTPHEHLAFEGVIY